MSAKLRITCDTSCQHLKEVEGGHMNMNIEPYYVQGIHPNGL